MAAGHKSHLTLPQQVPACGSINPLSRHGTHPLGSERQVAGCTQATWLARLAAYGAILHEGEEPRTRALPTLLKQRRATL
eukprot:363374-Chlamydomonas_euryale.AAC.6